jgi:hypothetical protein
MKPADVYEQELAPDEFERRLQTALADSALVAERAALIDWFTRRYPTPLERLAYARRRAAALRTQRAAAK